MILDREREHIGISPGGYVVDCASYDVWMKKWHRYVL